MIRTLCWVAAVGMLIAVFAAIERAPADPAPRSDRSTGGEAGEQAMVILSAPGFPDRPVISPRTHNGDGVRILDYTRFEVSPLLTVHSTATRQARAISGLWQALASAAEGALDEPALFELEARLEREDWTKPIIHALGRWGWMGVYPLGRAASIAGFETLPRSVLHGNTPQAMAVPGAIVALGTLKEHEAQRELWRTYAQATGWEAYVPIALVAKPEVFFFPTDILNPAADRDLDLVLGMHVQGILEALAVEIPGGLVCWNGNPSAVRSVLDDPRLIRAVWDLRASQYVDRGAHRIALCDDDPWIGELSATDYLLLTVSASAPAQPLRPLPPELLQRWPHPVAASEKFNSGYPANLILRALAPAAFASELRRLVRTAADTTRVAPLLAMMLEGETPEKRRVVRAVILETLPRGFVSQLAGRGGPLDWPGSERDDFFCAWVDRMRAEFSSGDAALAGDALRDVMTLLSRHIPRSDRAHSRILELAGEIVLDAEHGPLLRNRLANDTLREALRARLRDSDPEIRRQVCLLLKEARGDLPSELAGDPAVADLYYGPPAANGAQR